MQTKLKTLNWNAILKGMLFLAIGVGFLFAGHAFAQDAGSQNLGQLAEGITQSFSGIAKLMIAVSYVAGIGFVLASIFKFKQHKDNPTQIPLGTPLALLVIGIVLIFLPMIFGPAGETIFGKGATPGGFGGEGLQQIPGGDKAQ